MIKIKIPHNNIAERKYIIDIIFQEFFGLKYYIEIGSQEYELYLSNKKKLIIQDTFFNKFPNDLEYLHEKNIPKSIKELDVFAACFFMLTRWEEYVNRKRDKHNRFPAIASLAYREGFLDRPIVNELLEELKQQFLLLDNSLIFKEKTFQLILTHDVDEIYRWNNIKQVLRVMLGDIIKRKNISLALHRIKQYMLIETNKIQDPYDTFDWLMDKSEEIGVKSRFYFMSGGITQYDNRYKINEKKAKKIIQNIKMRDHFIGIHPSYNAYNNTELLAKEKKVLENIVQKEIVEGREHYLRFEVPKTWQIWEDNGFLLDSTCGYADQEGFRCGTGDTFSVFNILTRKKLALKERPLIFMDDNHQTYNNLTLEISLKKISKLITYAKKYNMQITFLFHNSIFTNDKNLDFKKLNESILELV